MAASETAQRHTRDDVARAALRLLDDVGLPDLTMRRLAAVLDVQPSALYHHFSNKQSLLAEVADRILAARPEPQPTDAWADAIRAEAGRLRDCLLAYRDGAEVVASTLSLGLGTAPAKRRLVAAVARGDFDSRIADRAATALLHFILGHVSDEQQRMQYDSLGVVAAPIGTAPTDTDPGAAFRWGVDVFVAGLAALRVPSAQRVPSKT